MIFSPLLWLEADCPALPMNAIRLAYHEAFSKDSKGIDAVLDDDGLQYAAAVRNLLIHKRGIVDDAFKRQTRSVVPDPYPFEEGKPFPLTGILCAELVDSCRCCAIWLVVEVHDWIIRHSEPRGDDGK